MLFRSHVIAFIQFVKLNTIMSGNVYILVSTSSEIII